MMAATSKIAELAQGIANKYNIDRKEAENFVALMFNVIIDGLRDEKQVKVKGLGTFKVTSVSARESVDVNTGERIVIEGRDKLSFTPETALKERVNAPFAQFETVVVDDDVDFSDIDRKYEEQLMVGADSSEETPSEPSVPIQAEKDNFSATVDVGKEQPIAADEAAEVIAPHDSTEASIVDEIEPKEVLEDVPRVVESSHTEVVDGVESEVMIVEAASEVAPKAAMVPLLSAEEHATPTADADVMSATVAADQEQKVENEKQLEMLATTNDMLQHKVERNNRWIRVLLGCAAVLLLGMVLGGFYLSGELSKRTRRIEHLEAQLGLMRSSKSTLAKKSKVSSTPMPKKIEKKASSVAPVNTTKKLNRVDEEAVKSSGSVANNGANLQKETQKVLAQPAIATVKAVEKAKKVKAVVPNPVAEKRPTTGRQALDEARFNEDARVRTGAYRIVGVAQTVTVRAGQTIQSISKTYLGPGMECYVEALNGRTVKVGDKVKIPELKLKKKK